MEQQTVSLKQCISEVTGKQIAMNGKDFIYLDDKTKVEDSVLGEANILMLQINKDNKIIDINKSCSESIISGFKSFSLQAEYLYQSDRDDQINLMGLVANGTDNFLKCGLVTVILEDSIEKEVITWDYKLHTIAQLKQVLADGAKYKLDLLTKANTLKIQVQNAITVNELNGINW